MNETMILNLAREALILIITISAPILIIALLIGLIVSIFQAVTSIQEPTLAFVPKILGVFLGLIVMGPWMISKMVEFIIKLYTNFNTYIIG